MEKYFGRWGDFPILENIWLGVTAENQEQADKRIPILLQIPAKVHFVSVEPMLSEIDLFNVDNEINQKMSEIEPKEMFFSADYIDWVICGGESGHNARPMNVDWVRSLKNQCETVNVPFFFKQGSQNNWANYKNFDSFPEDLKIRQMPLIKND
jgi:protein gp37